MPLPIAAVTGVLGGLLGGGTQTTQNTTVSSANNNTFNPTIVFGGDSNFTPTAPVINELGASSTASQTQEQADPADLLSVLNPVGDAGAAIGALGSVIGGGAASSVNPVTGVAFSATPAPAPLGLDSTVLLGLAAALAVGVVVFNPFKKKGA